MPIWKVTPVSEVPEIVLADFSIIEVDDGVRHFVGYNCTEREGRVSSAIVQFDIDRRRGVTRSGRVYELQGEPGWNSDAEYTWAAWRRLYQVTAWADVTRAALEGK